MGGEMLIDDLSKLPDQFKNGYRGVLLLHRNKDGLVGNAQRKAFKSITTGIEHWTETVERFNHLRKTAYPEHRIYSSVNSRNIGRAIHEFKKRQLEYDYSDNRELDEFYRDIQNRFFSCLMNPSCRNEKHFLVDCDSLDEYDRAINEIPEDLIIFDYATKNGRHIITKPFNPTKCETFNLIKKDDLLSIA